MTDKPTVHEAFTAVMGDVRSIAKADRNTAQGFMFRGIDAVLDEVGPALRSHGVHIVPNVEHLTAESYQTTKGTAMKTVTVTVRWRVWGPAGDYFDGSTYGEAADSGDKAVTKAQSVAYRTFLLQALTMPTGDRDPDSDSHERVAPKPRTPADKARDELAAVAKRRKLDTRQLGERFANDYGMSVYDADAETISAFAQLVDEEAAVDGAAG